MQLVMLNLKVQIDWLSYRPLNSPVIETWLDELDSEWEAAEAEYEGVALANVTDSVSEEGKENLIIYDSKINDETYSPSTEEKDGAYT